MARIAFRQEGHWLRRNSRFCGTAHHGRMLAGLAFVAAFCCSASALGVSPRFYESAPYAGPPQPGSLAWAVDRTEFIGARFQVTEPMVIDGIGGAFTAILGTLWGALVALPLESGVPRSTRMTTPDVLAHAVFTGPAGLSIHDLVIPVGPLSVPPGSYAVLFGGGGFSASGGNFGTNGGAAMPDYLVTGGPPSIMFGQPFMTARPWWTAEPSAHAPRLTVYGTVPEPGTLALATLTLAAGVWPRRPRRVQTASQTIPAR